MYVCAFLSYGGHEVEHVDLFCGTPCVLVAASQTSTRSAAALLGRPSWQEGDRANQAALHCPCVWEGRLATYFLQIVYVSKPNNVLRSLPESRPH